MTVTVRRYLETIQARRLARRAALGRAVLRVAFVALLGVAAYVTALHLAGGGG